MDFDSVKSTLSNLAFGNVMADAARDYQKISRDCQELEHSIGEQLTSLLYLEPDSDIMSISIAAELKREEASRLKEKATVGQKHG
ncbi:hypothetical protein OROGR_018182 [Orobanche gracilis]